MCRAMLEMGEFDPGLCPLLDGLSPEEIAKRVANDPHIQACSKAVSNPALKPEEALSMCAAEIREARRSGTFQSAQI